MGLCNITTVLLFIGWYGRRRGDQGSSARVLPEVAERRRALVQQARAGHQRLEPGSQDQRIAEARSYLVVIIMIVFCKCVGTFRISCPSELLLGLSIYKLIMITRYPRRSRDQGASSGVVSQAQHLQDRGRLGGYRNTCSQRFPIACDYPMVRPDL